MPTTPWRVALAALLACVPGATTAAAQQPTEPSLWSVSAVVSTLGLGAEFTGRANPIVGLRGGYFMFGLNRDDVVQGISYQLNPRLRNGTVMLDLHPGGKAFRISGGFLFNNSRVSAAGVLDGPVAIGDSVYQPTDVGQLTGLAKYTKKTMPYFGIGVASDARFTITVDAGLGFSGYPKVSLKADSPLTGPEREAFEQNLGQEEAQIQQEIESQWWAKFYPVFSIGFKLRF
jgi:hypothetical protein